MYFGRRPEILGEYILTHCKFPHLAFFRMFLAFTCTGAKPWSCLELLLRWINTSDLKVIKHWNRWKMIPEWQVLVDAVLHLTWLMCLTYYSKECSIRCWYFSKQQFGSVWKDMLSAVWNWHFRVPGCHLQWLVSIHELSAFSFYFSDPHKLLKTDSHFQLIYAFISDKVIWICLNISILESNNWCLPFYSFLHISK